MQFQQSLTSVYATQRYVSERLMIILDENDKRCQLTNFRSNQKHTENNENHLAKIRSWV